MMLMIAYASLLAETDAEKNSRMQWWRDAKFGLFIHWGPSSIIGKEISWCRVGHPADHKGEQIVPAEEYDNLYKQFNPVKFNADEWMDLAKEAGMKYVVIICKHHDGFAMFHTKLSDYNIANTPFKRDVIRELADAAHKRGLKFGVYYSTRDWYHPDYLKDGNVKYNDFYEGQVRELLSNYGRVDVMWFDHVSGNWKDYTFERLFGMIKQLQPGILINNRGARFVFKTEDKPTPELAKMVAGDYDTPEQTIGKFQVESDWESCMTMTKCVDGGGWSYRPDGKTINLSECIRTLVSCVTGGGNLLLNVGPMPTGEIMPDQVQNLKEIGKWLAKYGQAVYGTRGGPYVSGRWGGTCYSGNKVYLHVFEWRGDNLSLGPMKEKIVGAKVLTGGEAKVTQTDKGVDVILPKSQQDTVDTIIELTLDRPVSEVQKVAAERPLSDEPACGTIISEGAMVSGGTERADKNGTGAALFKAERPANNGMVIRTKQDVAPSVVIDLGKVKQATGVRIESQPISHAEVTISVSEDGTSWTTVATADSLVPVWEKLVTQLQAGAEVPGRKTRYLKLEAKSPRQRPIGLALRHVEIYGKE